MMQPLNFIFNRMVVRTIFQTVWLLKPLFSGPNTLMGPPISGFRQINLVEPLLEKTEGVKNYTLSVQEVEIILCQKFIIY